MKNKNLTGYLVDVLDDLSGPITISNTLDALYNVLNCDLIDITYLTLGEKEFCVIVDDEGLLKSSPKISAVISATLGTHFQMIHLPTLFRLAFCIAEQR